MPRLFVALDLPEPVRERLAEISTGLPGADWVYSDQYHLTLRFIGEVDPEIFAAVREGLGSVSARSFWLSLKGVGLFPLRGEPETLWAGIPKNEGLLSLRHKVESMLAKNGVPPDTRKFFPHVTLAKVGSSREAWVGQYVADHSLFSIPEIPVQGFSLYSSRLTPEGAIHTVEATYPLEGLLEAE
jgi:RNA 2',3'-cyclic 3'-phosphodiesterase